MYALLRAGTIPSSSNGRFWLVYLLRRAERLIVSGK